jgi:hypothetical protein
MELIRLAFGVIPKDVFYILIISGLVLWQLIKNAKTSPCPSHKHLLVTLANLENKVEWSNESLLKIAIKNDIELDPKPQRIMQCKT